jgi:hypothetical protein
VVKLMPPLTVSPEDELIPGLDLVAHSVRRMLSL